MEKIPLCSRSREGALHLTGMHAYVVQRLADSLDLMDVYSDSYITGQAPLIADMYSVLRLSR